MNTLTVGLGERSYPIFFGNEILEMTGSVCREKGLGKQAALITNTTVGPLYAEAVSRSLSVAGFTVHLMQLPDGEKYKNSETLNSIYDMLISSGLTRDSFIVALGGGVVGDMAGFAASTYLRGIPFIQVPTTLLSQVDSSVGGKTGINHPKGKNLIGAFYQPAAVIIDVATLTTLPEREYLAGLAEVIKYGIVLDGDFFTYLDENSSLILARDTECLLRIAERSCAIKASVVEQDEREAGLRAVLNYGHTLGHAVETLTGYETYLHGEAIAIGMVQAARISEAYGTAFPADSERILSLFRRLGLPTELPSFSLADYLAALGRDKKAGDRGLSFILNKGIGEFSITKISNVEELLKVCGIC